MLTDGSTGEQFCQKCGNVVVERIVDPRQERRSFSDDSNDKSRTGSPSSLAIHDRGLATTIGHENTDSTGKSLSMSMKQNMQRLRTWDSRSQAQQNTSRNLKMAFMELDKLKDKLMLSDSIIQRSAHIYRKAVGKNLVRGRSIHEIIGAAAYAACRDSGTPRTLNDFSDALNIKKKSLSRSYRMLINELELRMPVVDSAICVSKIASKIGLDERVRRHALEILRSASDLEMTAGKEPMGLAAAALYLSCKKYDMKTSQREFSMASGITEVTIRNRSRGLNKSLTENNL